MSFVRRKLSLVSLNVTVESMEISFGDDSKVSSGKISSMGIPPKFSASISAQSLANCSSVTLSK